TSPTSASLIQTCSAKMAAVLHAARHDTQAPLGQISAVFAKAGSENQQTQEPGHVRHARRSQAARTSHPVLQATPHRIAKLNRFASPPNGGPRRFHDDTSERNIGR